MVDADDIAYFTARAAAERALGEASDNQEVALVHLKLAERYERLAARPAGPRPTLHIVAPRSR